MLLLEAGVAMGRMLIPVLLPGLVAAACGYSVFVGLGDWGGIETQTLSVPGLPVYDGTSVGDLLAAVALGVVIAVVIGLVRKLAARVHGLEGSTLPMPALLIGGGLCVGLLALVADALGAQPNEIFFSGQAAVPELVQETSAGILLVILAAKALAFAVSLGCGFRGGPVFPSIFLGVGIVVLAGLALDLSPTLAVSVGTAAGMAAMTGLLFSSVLFAGLLTGSAGADAIPAAVLAAAAAWVVRAALERRAGDGEAQPAAGR